MRSVGPLILLVALGTCQPRSSTPEHHGGGRSERAHGRAPASAPERAAEQGSERAEESVRYDELRQTMVDEQLAVRGIRDERVLRAMATVPRHEFVLDAYRSEAYDDTALPIEEGQTISQPYIVGLMSQLADVKPGEKVLEVGTGSGYQAAVLAAMGARVFSIEIVQELAKSARARLARLNYPVEVRHGDGYAGWPEQAPFDAILITAAPPEVPEPLKQQLAVGGRLVVPIGEGDQDLWVWTRTENGLERRSVIPVRFVPMTGEAQRKGR